MRDSLSTSRLRAALSALLHRVGAIHDETGNRFPYVYDERADEWETTENGN